MSGNINFNGWLNDDGSENYKCRAWVNFNGTGTVAIRASGGVSSITDNGTGLYTINFTAAMPDGNYVMSGSAGNATGTTTTGRAINRDGTWTTNAADIRVLRTDSSAVIDNDYVGLAFFR